MADLVAAAITVARPEHIRCTWPGHDMCRPCRVRAATAALLVAVHVGADDMTRAAAADLADIINGETA